MVNWAIAAAPFSYQVMGHFTQLLLHFQGD